MRPCNSWNGNHGGISVAQPSADGPSWKSSRPAHASRWRASLALVFFLSVIFVLALGGHAVDVSDMDSTQAKKGDRIMSNDELVEALRQLDPNQERAVSTLSKRFEENARAPVRAAVSMLSDKDPKMSERATAVITNIGDLAIVPLLESPQPREAADRVWNLNVVVQAHLEERGKVISWINARLSDKTNIPWGKVGGVEGVPRSSRVCDEAYLMMRRMLNFSEDKEHFVRERDIFLGLSDEQKDHEILKAKSSHTWTNLVEGEE